MAIFSITDAVIVDVDEMPAKLLEEFREFLRLNSRIPPRSEWGEKERNGNNLNGNNLSYYHGVFSKKSAEKIEQWLLEKGCGQKAK